MYCIEFTVIVIIYTVCHFLYWFLSQPLLPWHHTLLLLPVHAHARLSSADPPVLVYCNMVLQYVSLWTFNSWSFTGATFIKKLFFVMSPSNSQSRFQKLYYSFQLTVMKVHTYSPINFNSLLDFDSASSPQAQDTLLDQHPKVPYLLKIKNFHLPWT